MELAFLVYAISLLGSFSAFFVGLAFVSAFVVVASGIGITTWAFDGDFSWDLDSKGQVKSSVARARGLMVKIFKISATVLILSLLIRIMIPSERTAYTMVGAYAAQKIAQDPKTVQVGEKVYTLINQKLDEFIAEGIEKAEKAAKGK